MIKLSSLALALAGLMSVASAADAPLKKGPVMMKSILKGQWRFGGEFGARIDGNVENWLLRMPGANPGLLEMFHRRDRHWPYERIVPWAGEFAGKYLISAVQACRMTDDPRVKPFVQNFVDQLIACQDADGYLGPWPKSERLMGEWDLWGHYHCMLGLLMWYDDTGDQKAYDCVLRAAECICKLYIDSGRRPIEAGSPPMNLSVLHIFGELYRRTANPRYLTMCQRIEEDLPKDGDWLHRGAEGAAYYQLPGSGPRWESLHIVEGFEKLYEATGDEKYKKALLGLWDSIRKYDRHPTGAFSSDEGASGSIYGGGSIETCCSVAWTALTVDALRMTGDSTCADELELTLWNEGMGCQHPSGSWCTYDTPLDGTRAPSYHQIVFQSRIGTPELNCCSVNASRILGAVSEWAVTSDADGLAVNFYGPSTIDVPLGADNRVKLVQATKYPAEGLVHLTVEPKHAASFTLRLRIPAWSKATSVKVNGQPAAEAPKPGTYLALHREWKAGDVVELSLDMTPRYDTGQGPRRGGRAAIHVGPLLLSFDAEYNAIETADLKPIDMSALRLEAAPVTMKRDGFHFPPMGLWRTATDGGDAVYLCDFASAGAMGTDYVSWLPASHVPPAATMLKTPVADATGQPGELLFRWTPTGASGDTYDLLVAKDAAFQQIVLQEKGLKGAYTIVKPGLTEAGAYYWKIVATNAFGATDNRDGPRKLVVDTAAKSPFLIMGEDGLMVSSPLDGDGTPTVGLRSIEEQLTPAPDRKGNPRGAVALNGTGSRLRYDLPFFPERDYSFYAWICPEGLPVSSIKQVFSGWCRGGDDPLRLTIDGHAIFARIEGSGGGGTQGVELANGEWVHVAAVKQGTTLTLYVNGKSAQSTGIGEYIHSQSTQIGIGFNPLFPGGEYFKGKIDDFAFYARALSPEEIAKVYAR
jgi:hypothetical protein